ncbi:MAG: hypothetical protein U0414_39665 [Polyangiaceae bacterium]
MTAPEKTLALLLLLGTAACSSKPSDGGSSAKPSATSAAAPKPSTSGAKPGAADSAVSVNTGKPAATPKPSSTEKPTGEHAKDPILSEAKNTLGAISRAANESYSREPAAEEIVPDGSASAIVENALCSSAKPVPDKLPSGGERIPIKEDDWGGDAKSGWRCLRFVQTEPVPFRYTYNVRTNYLSPARGGEDPGPNGFEACAEADLTPGGLTTLLCVTGVVDPETHTLKTSTSVFQADE